MGLLELVIILALVGVGLWALQTYVPMDAGIKRIIHIVVIVAVVIYLLRVFGIFGHDIPVHGVR